MHVRGPTMLEELSKRLQYCCTTLRWSQNKLLGFVGSNVWLVWLWATIPNNTEQHAETNNRVYLRTRHVTPNNAGSCWPTMLRLFAQGALHIVSWYCRLRALEKQAINSLCHSGGLPNISVVSLLGDFCRNFEVWAVPDIADSNSFYITYLIYLIEAPNLKLAPASNKRPSSREEKLISAQPLISTHPELPPAQRKWRWTGRVLVIIFLLLYLLPVVWTICRRYAVRHLQGNTRELFA